MAVCDSSEPGLWLLGVGDWDREMRWKRRADSGSAEPGPERSWGDPPREGGLAGPTRGWTDLGVSVCFLTQECLEKFTVSLNHKLDGHAVSVWVLGEA